MRNIIIVFLFFLFSCTDGSIENKGGHNKDSIVSHLKIDEKIDSKVDTVIRFSVSDVKIAPTFLSTNNAKRIFQEKLEKKILFMPEEQKDSLYVYCGNNAFLQTIQECYDNHRPLILSPDIIWLSICQGVSIHINEKFDSLRSSIFVSSTRDTIVIRNDSLEFGDEHWKDFIGDLSAEAQKRIKKDFYSFYVSKYSTTSDIETTAEQITMLEGLKKGFVYVGESGCGIPEIKLKGTKEDWILLKSKLKELNSLGLEVWSQNLSEVMDEFINVYDGKINKPFWQSIYKSAEEYNAYYISGWVLKFFPYILVKDFDGTYNDMGSRAGEKYIPNRFLNGSDYLLSRLSTDNIPSGIAKIDVRWDDFYKNKSTDLLVCSGFFAMKQYPDKSLEPLISWAVCDKKARINDQHRYGKNLNLVHKPDFWSPTICNQPKQKAIYDSKKYKTHKESMEVLRVILQDELKHHVQSVEDMSNLEVEFTVLSNGIITDVKIGNKKLKQHEKTLTKCLKKLPEEWMPALSNVEDVLMLMGDGEQLRNKKVKVNSKVKIRLFKK